MEPNKIDPLISAVYAAFNRRDLDGVLVYLHPEVHWPNGWEGGYVDGHAGVRDYWTRQWKELDPVVIPLRTGLQEDGKVEVEVKQTVKDLKGNLVADGLVRHLYTLENGLIKRMDIGG